MTAKKPTPVPKESDWSKHDGPRPTSPPPPRKKTASETDQLRQQLDEALDALMMMVEQYCPSNKKLGSGKPFFDHMFMAAGETACEVLEKHGRINGAQYD